MKRAELDALLTSMLEVARAGDTPRIGERPTVRRAGDEPRERHRIAADIEDAPAAESLVPEAGFRIEVPLKTE